MYPLSPFFCLLIFAIAFFTAFVLNKIFKPNTINGRFESVDGLRGFLAIGVFIHHASIWHQYLQKGVWDVPKSNVYTLLGQGSVSLFFMITSFLFVNKILNAKEGNFNFKAFFISRLYRLTPLYLFTILVLILIVMLETNWRLNVPLLQFAKSIVAWLLFSIFGNPSINGAGFTTLVNAGVVWSLPYEWFFYFTIPIIYLISWRRKISLFFVIISIGFVTFFFIKFGFVWYHLVCFVGGAIAPIIMKYFPIYKKINKYLASAIVLLCLFFMGKFDTSHNWKCILLLSIMFTIIALGNDLFGLLKNSSLKLLGEICYSTYLLHGIIIFTLIHFLLGQENVKQYSPQQYCYIIFMLTPIVVIISFFSYRFIEYPFMQKAALRNIKKN